MDSALVRLTRKVVLILTPLVAATLSLSQVLAATGGGQYCRPGGNCIIGEFLYDDNYAPINDALCLLSSYYPNGTGLFSDEVMATGSAGWYAHEFTTPATNGYYRSQVCCHTNGEMLCLDKSFEVEENEMNTEGAVAGAVWDADRSSYNTAGSFGEALQNTTFSTGDIASAVWGYSGRTLSDFGTLVSDVWSYSTRTLSNFGTLINDIWNFSDRSLTTLEGQVSQIWNHEDRSLTSSVHVHDQSVSTITNSVVDSLEGNIGSFLEGDLGELKSLVLANRDLLERLVNAPIVETYIEEEEEVPDLSEKIEETIKVANNLYMDGQVMEGKLGLLKVNWEEMSERELADHAGSLSEVLGGEEDSRERGSMFGWVNWIKENWGFEVAEKLYSQLVEMRGVVVKMKQLAVDGEGEKEIGGVVMELVAFRPVVAGLIGGVEEAGSASVYGEVERVKQVAEKLDSQEREALGLIEAWGNDSSEGLYSRANRLAIELTKVNQLNRVANMIEVGVRGMLSKKELKNTLLSIRGVIAANRKLLASKPGQGFWNVWLEEGSMVFKALITNPSRRISQEVPLKYYLPPELREEDVLETDLGLSVVYDAERDQYYVEGTFELSPSESKTVAVRTEDIWKISAEEIDSLKVQVSELSRPLERTSYFAQGVTLSSDINVTLDKILVEQVAAVTPEQQIRAYREAQVELVGVAEKIGKLQELVTMAGSQGSLLGFVGGAQAIAVWGLIIIMVAGFVFLALYMKVLRGGAGLARKSKKITKVSRSGRYVREIQKKKWGGWGWMGLVVPVVVLVLGGIVIGGAVVARGAVVSTEEETGVASEVVMKESNLVEGEEVVVGEPMDKDTEAVGGVEVVEVVVDDGVVLVYEEPDEAAEVVAELIERREVIRIGGYGDWVNVVLKSADELGVAVTGWVEAIYVKTGKGEEAAEKSEVMGVVKEEEGAAGEIETVMINKTTLGWLRVRKYPQGPELTQVNSGDVYPVLDEEKDWVMIGLDDGSIGWVASDYVTKVGE